MNSCVPNVLSSVTPPQFGFNVTDRSRPMPLRQWYSSAKQPPGQRTFGTLIAFKRGHDVVADAAGVRDG